MAGLAKVFSLAAALSMAAATSCDSGSCLDDETSLVQVQKSLKQAHAHSLNETSETSASGSICCCKKGYCNSQTKEESVLHEACIGQDCPRSDKSHPDIQYYCCTPKTYSVSRGCPTTSGYKKPMQSLDFDGKVAYDSDTCHEVSMEAPEAGRVMLTRVNAFKCITGFEKRCEQAAAAAEQKAAEKAAALSKLPEDWASKPKICHGTHSFLRWLAPAAPLYFDVTQGTGIVKASGANGITPALIGDLAAVAGPIAIAGGAAGVLVNVLKLIDGVCINGWTFLTDGNCAAMVSMTAVVLGVVALSLTFTGVGVPISALLLGGSSFVTRRLGKDLCTNGIWATMKSMAKTAFETMSEVVAHIQSQPAELSTRGKMFAAAKKAAMGFFGLLFSLLKNIAVAIPTAFKAMFGPPEEDDDDQKECCTLYQCKAAFSEIDSVDEEMEKALAGPHPTDEEVEKKIAELKHDAQQATFDKDGFEIID